MKQRLAPYLANKAVEFRALRTRWADVAQRHQVGEVRLFPAALPALHCPFSRIEAPGQGLLTQLQPVSDLAHHSHVTTGPGRLFNQRLIHTPSLGRAAVMSTIICHMAWHSITGGADIDYHVVVTAPRASQTEPVPRQHHYHRENHLHY
jgi:hypothetical protein